jgi:hypothetical protein
MVLKDVPDTLVFNDIISVDKDVPEIHNLAEVGNRRCDLGFSAREPAEPFTDENKLPLDT